MKRRGRYDEEMQKFERTLLLCALEANQWNRVKAAASLGLCYRTIMYRIKAHGLVAPAKENHAS